MGQRHAYNPVAKQQREEDGLVGLRAGTRLDIGQPGAEQVFDLIDGDGLGFVDERAAAITAAVAIPLRIFSAKVVLDNNDRSGHRIDGLAAIIADYRRFT